MKHYRKGKAAAKWLNENSSSNCKPIPSLEVKEEDCAEDNGGVFIKVDNLDDLKEFVEGVDGMEYEGFKEILAKNYLKPENLLNKFWTCFQYDIMFLEE